MPLRLITGPVNSGKTSNLLDALAKHDGNGESYFVVPTEQLAGEFRLHAFSGRNAILGETFVSWQRFLRKLARPDSHLINSREVRALMLAALREAKLSYFAASRGSAGTARLFADTIISFKENGVDAKKFRELIDSRLCSDRERDLLSAFEAYEKLKSSKGLLDSGDIFFLALENIKNKTPSISGATFIAFDEFHRVDHGMRIIIEALVVSFPQLDIIVSLPEATDENAFYTNYLKKARTTLAPICTDEQRLKSRGSNPAALTAFKTRSHLQEARFIADEILAHLGDGTSWRDVAVLHRSGPLLQDLMDESAITELMPREYIPHDELGAPCVHEILSFKSLEALPSHATIAEYGEALASLVQKARENMQGQGEGSSYEIRSASSLERLDSAIKAVSLADWLADIKNTSRETYVQMLTDELAATAPSTQYERRIDCRLIPFDSGLAFPAEFVLMPSMLEGNIPSSSGERAFFAGNEDLSPVQDGIIDEILGNTEDALAADSFILDSILAKCTRKVIFSYPAVGLGGSESIPSSFLDMMAKDVGIAKPLQLASSAKMGTEDIEKKVRIEFERASRQPKEMQYHGEIISGRAKELLKQRFGDKAFGATDLEKYAECPFEYFAEKVLNLRAPDEDTPEMVPRHRGTIFHEVLEDFYTKHKAMFKELISDPAAQHKVGALVRKLVEEKVRENPELVQNVEAGLYDIQLGAICTMATSVIAAEATEARSLAAPLFPERCEWSFGFDDANFLEVGAAGCVTSKIKGKVDRIDTAPDGSAFLVVDYKTGSVAKPMTNQLLEGTKLQLPLYVAAVKRFLHTAANPLGGLLINTKTSEKKFGFVKKEFNGIHFDVGGSYAKCKEEAWNNIMAKAIEASAIYAHSIKSGAFNVGPSKDCPKYCKYEYACRFPGKKAD